MKTESEFGFEPSLLIEMERAPNSEGRRAIKHQATVIGDRFSLLDGKVFLDPKFRDFEPHVKMLKPGALSPVDTTVKSDTGIDESGDAEWNRERRERTILAEEIQGLLMVNIPGMAAKDKQEKAQLLFDAFKTRSWTAVENLSSQTLRHGLAFLRDRLEGQKAAADLPLGAPADGVPFQATDEDVPI